MIERDETSKNKSKNKTISRKLKTNYIVKSYFIGTIPLKDLIERLASKDAKDLKNIQE